MHRHVYRLFSTHQRKQLLEGGLTEHLEDEWCWVHPGCPEGPSIHSASACLLPSDHRANKGRWRRNRLNHPPLALCARKTFSSMVLNNQLPFEDKQKTPSNGSFYMIELDAPYAIYVHSKIYKPTISTSCSYEDPEKDFLFDNKEWQERECRGLVLCSEKALGTTWRWKVDRNGRKWAKPVFGTVQNLKIHLENQSALI